MQDLLAGHKHGSISQLGKTPELSDSQSYKVRTPVLNGHVWRMANCGGGRGGEGGRRRGEGFTISLWKHARLLDILYDYREQWSNILTLENLKSAEIYSPLV